MLGQEPAGPLPVEGPLTTSERSTARRTTRLLAVALILGGCSASADVAGLATQDELLRLRSEVTSLQRTVQQTRAQTEALNSQLAGRTQGPSIDAERSAQSQEINQRLDGLSTTLGTLTRRIDELTTRVDALGRQARSSAVRPGPIPGATAAPVAPPAFRQPGVTPSPIGPTPGAVSSVPSTAAPVTAAPVLAPPATAAPAIPAPPAAGAATAGPATARPATAAPVTPGSGSAPPGATAAAPSRSSVAVIQPQDLYQASYIDFSKGSYSLAIDGFREFLRRYPDHAQASSAQYWIGEGYVALAQQHANAGQTERSNEALQRAVQEFRKVVANYPRGDRVPTALYKEAMTLVELKQPALAQARLQYLVDNFPQAEEVPLARERLAALRQR